MGISPIKIQTMLVECMCQGNLLLSSSCYTTIILLTMCMEPYLFLSQYFVRATSQGEMSYKSSIPVDSPTINVSMIHCAPYDNLCTWLGLQIGYNNHLHVNIWQSTRQLKLPSNIHGTNHRCVVAMLYHYFLLTF